MLAIYFWAIVNEARSRRVCPSLDPKWVVANVRGMERGLTMEEQAEPLTVPVLGQLGAASRNDVNFI